MIKVEGLTKLYGDRAAINNLNFEVNKGEVVGFLGPNGAGKTTTMKILTGFMAPTSGLVTIGGVDIFEDPILAKSKIGYLPEKPPLYMDMKVEKYLAFVAGLRGVEKDSMTSSVDKALECLDLKEVRGRVIGNLSKGFRQRVGIAQAIVSNPEVLILDEPTVGLDPSQVAHFRELLKELKGKHTIIVSTHILPEVQASCERVVIINEGHIVAQDSLKSLSQKTTGGVRRVKIKVQRVKDQFSKVLEDLEFVKMSSFAGQHLHVDLSGGDESLEELSSRVVESGMGLIGMEVSTEKLEDIFLELTSKS
ncbi:MAG: ABC transporter ATP-binding protein [Bdellovibrionales bacterium]